MILRRRSVLTSTNALLMAAFSSGLFVAACAAGDVGSLHGRLEDDDSEEPIVARAEAGRTLDDTASDADGGTDGACASSSAVPVPSNLVFMFSRSKDMKKDSKWDACRAGLKTFLADAKSAGANASLQFFAQSKGKCEVATYQTPLVPIRPLPDSTTLGRVLDTATLDDDDDVPALPALRGALAYATSLSGAPGAPPARTAVVLVTDHEPDGCNSSTRNVAATAELAKDKVPTYVIGVGKSLAEDLDPIARGGGTGKALLVSTGNTAATARELVAAVQKIRGELSCDFALPAATAKAFDASSVNVVQTLSTGTTETLFYNKDCTGGGGWHYDDATKPTKLRVCPRSCPAQQADNNKGKLDITVGCPTKGGVVK